ncbi:aminotransferase [Ponticoccus sp. SC2-23]|uniref:aminotransferase n=1 Tax=Alexandriicola marinus TaxID=2081710 RepID=UPI000FD827FC|nr:aminotransferase [Alexandriicola marinus]MBM1219231.1 aminotransferase [Ponticoccus sp. SC6-9]MBM1223697.1 aminotransferase [Ponticoccus sp. SC6-15]MBM1229044.1 aminotransferase [Ponticoccus sp. SC6-38]MBM1232663.1 aminotransferase [Ponticoccus sp. SC6-45]MBM1237387.1 aminotransferase [Ponticoccus sp. SC6-49]MBM1241674.1 aminotransferase [Ponticoccus sp. SC2-64]MBM1246187.1 aminotransferase [Ponticoccus sp. SC6-42]MBM1250665.1 aminotransferase [Ponticoccus sp. SC6-33]MBM1255396.1 aminot
MTPGRTASAFAPPIMAAQSWLRGVVFPPDRPLINVSQAAPVGAPPLALREAMAALVRDDPDVHLYGPVLGLPELRTALAAKWSRDGGHVDPQEVAITSGCNQAYAAAMMSLCEEGSNVILPVPYYFNHRMWNDMSGIKTVPLPTGPDLLPDPTKAAALITSETRAIVLVSPNNPGGVEYPPDLVGAFFDLARDAGIALVIDETYRDFDARPGPPHDLFARPGWQETLIQLYSFSKAYRLTGHRVGAMTAGADRIAEAEKFLDSVAICANQLGQRAALWGMQNLDDWLAAERAEILARRAAIAEGFPALASQGWRLMGLGAYFAYVEHPFAIPSDDLARQLVRDASVLLLPGTMFMPDDIPGGADQLRIAFANIDAGGIATLFDRLAGLDYPRRGPRLAEPPPGQ